MNESNPLQSYNFLQEEKDGGGEETWREEQRKSEFIKRRDCVEICVFPIKEHFNGGPVYCMHELYTSYVPYFTHKFIRFLDTSIDATVNLGVMFSLRSTWMKAFWFFQGSLINWEIRCLLTLVHDRKSRCVRCFFQN